LKYAAIVTIEQQDKLEGIRNRRLKMEKSKDEKIHIRFLVVMETYPINNIALRQEVCVFDNTSKESFICKHPEQIDVSNVWNDIKKTIIRSKYDLEQFQKEVKHGKK
jgi:hypothetical protein